MKTKAASQKQPGALIPGASEINILEFPALNRIILSGMPSLGNGSERSKLILDEITRFLFLSPKLEDPALADIIPLTLYESLCGYKPLFKKYGVRKALLFIEIKKSAFEERLRDMLLKGQPI